MEFSFDSLSLAFSNPLHLSDIWDVCDHPSGLIWGKTRGNSGSAKQWMKCFPHRERLFFCLTSSRGNLRVLLSSSVPLILPLIQHSRHVKPKVHMQADPGQQSRAYQSMKWKKNPPPSHTHTLPTPNKWHDIAPDKADKVTWPATSDGQWSRVVTTPRRGDGLTEVNLHSIYFPPASGKTNYTTIDDNKFTQWINSRAMFVMY